MIRKLILGGAAIAVIGGLVAGKDVFSYARTGLASARKHFRHEVPVEFEIERARHEVERLLPEVRRSLHLIAEEQVEVAQLKKSISQRQSALKTQEEAILTMSADLKNDDVRFVYAGQKYSRREVQKDLAERFNRFKIAEETVKQEQQVLTAKEKALAANRETLETMLSQKKNLEVELERLEARVRTIDARKQVHGLNVDDSQLNRVRTLIATIEKRLDVEDAVLASSGDLNGLIPIERDQAEESENISTQIDHYFHSGRSDRIVQTGEEE